MALFLIVSMMLDGRTCLPLKMLLSRAGDIPMNGRRSVESCVDSPLFSNSVSFIIVIIVIILQNGIFL